eukprot:2076806-Prymnesium_polylepis.2
MQAGWKSLMSSPPQKSARNVRLVRRARARTHSAALAHFCALCSRCAAAGAAQHAAIERRVGARRAADALHLDVRRPRVASDRL